MNRSLRRHQQRVAKIRRIRILRSRGVFRPMNFLGHTEPAWRWPDKPWRPLCDLVMNEPGWWCHEHVVAPARIDTHRLEHAIECGRDPDTVLWPDCKRPYAYYW